jgi:hypothetical protein
MRSANLSAVMSNYNHARFLPRAISAILEQSVRPKELFIIDDCSTDHSMTVLEEFSRRDPIIHIVRNERNLGVCETVTRGTRLATCEYLLYAAADDYILPGMIEKSLDLLARHPTAGMSCGFGSTIDEVAGELCPNATGWCERPCYLTPVDLAAHIGAGYIPSTSALYRRASVERAGGYLPDLRWHCDWFMNLVIGFRQGICHIPETLALITVRPTTYSAQGMKDEQAMRAVVTALLRRLSSPAYCDLIPLFQHSGVMGPFFPYLAQLAASPPAPGRSGAVQTEAGSPELDPSLQALAAQFLAPLCERMARLREEELKQSRQQLAEAQSLIAGMRSSKFWKIREVAVRCKNAIPLFQRKTA